MEIAKGENHYTATCASCGKDALKVTELYTDIPRFGNAVMITMNCPDCGYRVFDIISLEDRGPVKVSYHVKSPMDLSARVIRSSTSTVTIPELGLELVPGNRSDAFITNIEGLLDRFLAVGEQLVRSAEGEVEKKNAEVAVQRIKEAMDGKVAFTVTLSDEFGNGAILSPDGDSPSPSS